MFRTISELYGLARGQDDNGFRLLLYHKIISEPGDNSLGKLKRQITSIKERIVQDLVSALESISSQDIPGFAITFDDGYSELYTEVCPLLEELNVPYLLYLTPGLLGKSEEDYLSRAQVKEMASWKGCFFGAHGLTHKNLKKCSGTEVHEEIITSQKMLEHLTGVAISSFAFPYGGVTAKALEILKESSYTSAVTSRTGINHAGSPRWGRDPTGDGRLGT